MDTRREYHCYTANVLTPTEQPVPSATSTPKTTFRVKSQKLCFPSSIYAPQSPYVCRTQKTNKGIDITPFRGSLRLDFKLAYPQTADHSQPRLRLSSQKGVHEVGKGILKDPYRVDGGLNTRCRLVKKG